MVAIITKSEERKAHEQYVARSFGVGANDTAERREAAELVAARTREAYNTMRKKEDKKK